MSRRDFSPGNSLNELRREMDRLLDGFVGGVNRGFPFRGRIDPPVDVWEDGGSVCVEVEVPGVSMSSIDVQVEDDVLLIKGNRVAREGQGLNFHRQERAAGEFSRRVDLPCAIEHDRVEAVLRDGVLTITLPKSGSAKVRKIDVKGE